VKGYKSKKYIERHATPVVEEKIEMRRINTIPNDLGEVAG
jgi:hypothetical protein